MTWDPSKVCLTNEVKAEYRKKGREQERVEEKMFYPVNSLQWDPLLVWFNYFFKKKDSSELLKSLFS